VVFIGYQIIASLMIWMSTHISEGEVHPVFEGIYQSTSTIAINCMCHIVTFSMWIFIYMIALVVYRNQSIMWAKYEQTVDIQVSLIQT